ncbi:MAG: Asp-tRNA(Asn)/Glu-tRNA(Gln) amidotransferase subunit GatB, partial [bacterium]|nr:Asp-tRNA(Asn)/Glu-tRNA(Gln) amidotransferase subunit GatB [bacterium]
MAEKAFPVKIGLEVHGYLDTREKLFCMCRTDSLASEANSNICPICTGTPGSKPMAANGEAVRKMVQVAMVLRSKINYEELIWQRKHYDWADNPKGYQTTMSGAHAKVNAKGGKFAGIGIWEIHLEEDPAQWNPGTGRVDYNRSGLPLIEIVTAPSFKNSEQVVDWLKRLVHSLGYVKAIRKNAGIKVDVNVSTYGERVEMKNLNSLEKIRKAIDYEVARQLEAYGGGKGGNGGSEGYVQKQETRAYDEAKGKTVLMRSKENAADYRFIPCPDLAVLKVSKEMVAEVKKGMPEMPDVKLARLLKEYKVGDKDAKILTRNLELVDFFEELVGEGKGAISTRMNTDGRGLDVGKVLPWVTVELLRVLNYNKKTLDDADVTILPEHLAELIRAVEDGA